MSADRRNDALWTEHQQEQAAEFWSRPVCPNEDDDFLCVWHDDIGAFVPEAGCPVHDVVVRR